MPINTSASEAGINTANDYRGSTVCINENCVTLEDLKLKLINDDINYRKKKAEEELGFLKKSNKLKLDILEEARALNKGLPIGNEELEQYSAIDDDYATCEEPTEEYILQNVIVNSQDSKDNSDDDLEKNCTTLSIFEVLKAAEVLNVTYIITMSVNAVDLAAPVAREELAVQVRQVAAACVYAAVYSAAIAKWLDRP
ncbi:hypothetical protein EVAR_89395_1 [Eumeta japonica]|uniref:Uncharacterized protein n=1 Tax=Eumeta variegata TaxID=151549 RepID=A0A4C1XSC9_EUMVA|nr:hypothetical protein EVAR_89395_1 [Eumeta japonica]